MLPCLPTSFLCTWSYFSGSYGPYMRGLVTDICLFFICIHVVSWTFHSLNLHTLSSSSGMSYRCNRNLSLNLLVQDAILQKEDDYDLCLLAAVPYNRRFELSNRPSSWEVPNNERTCTQKTWVQQTPTYFWVFKKWTVNHFAIYQFVYLITIIHPP